MISLFEMASNYSAEILFSIPKCKKTVMCFMEKINVFHKLQSNMSFIANSCEFKGSEFTVCIK